MILWPFIIFIFFFVFEIEPANVPGKIRPNFVEIFGNKWEENKEENYLESIDQMPNEQNTIENDQNTKEEQNNQQKKETIHKFEAIKEKLKEKGKYQWKNSVKIEFKIAKLLGVNRKKIYKWKKELNLNKKNFYEEKKSEFNERLDEFKRLYGQGKQKEFVKELGISYERFRRWKKELLPNDHKTKNKYSNEDKLRKVKQYTKIKEINPKISDEKIAKKLGIERATLIRWKKKFASIPIK